jgi:predicted O-methyltransferase YrrM
VTDTHFKGWAKPGPIPPGAHSQVQVAENETLDAISGHFRIFQLKRGHRFSTDDVLTAWYGTAWAPAAATILDLGSGIGSVGMIAAWRLAGARVVTIEAQAESVQLARKSAVYNGLSDRYDIRLGDFRDDRALDPAERFDLVFGSPRKSMLGRRCHQLLPDRHGLILAVEVLIDKTQLEQDVRVFTVVFQ